MREYLSPKLRAFLKGERVKHHRKYRQIAKNKILFFPTFARRLAEDVVLLNLYKEKNNIYIDQAKDAEETFRKKEYEFIHGYNLTLLSYFLNSLPDILFVCALDALCGWRAGNRKPLQTLRKIHSDIKAIYTFCKTFSAPTQDIISFGLKKIQNRSAPVIKKLTKEALPLVKSYGPTRAIFSKLCRSGMKINIKKKEVNLRSREFGRALKLLFHKKIIETPKVNEEEKVEITLTKYGAAVATMIYPPQRLPFSIKRAAIEYFLSSKTVKTAIKNI